MSRTLPFVLWIATACHAAETPLEGPSPDALSRMGDTWYQLTVDDRDCATCGGFFVDAVNHRTTACPDGTAADACHVDALDTALLAMTADQQTRFDLALSEGRLLVWGRMTADPTTTTPTVSLGLSDAREGLSGAVPSGAVVWVQETGRLCGPLPCEDLREWRANSPSVRTIADLDFTASALTDEQVAAAWDAAADRRGLFVAGRRATVDDGAGGTLAARTVTEAWVPLAP